MTFTSKVFAFAAVAAVAARLPAQVPLDHRELPADQQIIHSLNRLTFGPRPGDVQRVRAMGLEKWIDLQLHPEKIDDSSLQRFLDRYDVLEMNQNDLLRDFAQTQRNRRMAKRQAGDTAIRNPGPAAALIADPELRRIATTRRAMVTQLQSSRAAHAVATNRQLQEVMTDFWLNHFNVYAQKGAPEAYYLAEYDRDIIRPNALGHFRDLLGSVARSPAMLFYLDNARSMADSTRPRLARLDRRRPPRGGQIQQRLNQLRSNGLNENYGRELLELHTLGVDGGYTQQDVISVARALTGWTIRPPAAGGGFIFRPEMHDAGEKTVLGHKLRAGRGIEDGEDVLDIVARHPATARYIATKLARRFISDNPPQAVIERAAQVFLRTDGDIREVVRTIIMSNEFFAQSAFRAKVKSPFEVVISAMRAMNASPDSTARTAQAIAYLGEPLYGHQAPNGYPETGDAWMNTGAILNRINFGIAAAAGRIPGAALGDLPGFDSLAGAPRARQVDAVVSLLLGGAASADTRAILLSGENPLTAAARPEDSASAPAGDDVEMDATMAPSAGKGLRAAARNPFGRPGSAPPKLTGMAQVVGLALGSPEFQRR